MAELPGIKLQLDTQLPCIQRGWGGWEPYIHYRRIHFYISLVNWKHHAWRSCILIRTRSCCSQKLRWMVGWKGANDSGEHFNPHFEYLRLNCQGYSQSEYQAGMFGGEGAASMMFIRDVYKLTCFQILYSIWGRQTYIYTKHQVWLPHSWQEKNGNFSLQDLCRNCEWKMICLTNFHIVWNLVFLPKFPVEDRATFRIQKCCIEGHFHCRFLKGFMLYNTPNFLHTMYRFPAHP